MRPRLRLILCTALALAGCGGEAKKETGGKAGGEILPASVSDAMLPRDTVRSQAPLAPTADRGETGKDKQGDKPKASPAPQIAPELEPEPQPEPAEPAD